MGKKDGAGRDQAAPSTDGIDPFDKRLARGIQCVQDGCYSEAMPLLKAVLREDEANRDAWYGLGYCYYKHGNLLQSRLMFERALDLGNRAASEMLARIEYRLEKERHQHDLQSPPSLVSIDGAEEYTSPFPQDSQDDTHPPTPVPPLEGEGLASVTDILEEPDAPEEDSSFAEGAAETESGSEPIPLARADDEEELQEDSAQEEQQELSIGATVDDDPAWEAEAEKLTPAWDDEEPDDDDELPPKLSLEALISGRDTPEPEDNEPPAKASSDEDERRRSASSDETPYPDLYSRLVSESESDELDATQALLVGEYDFVGTPVGLWGVGMAAFLLTVATGGFGLPIGILWLTRYVIDRSVVADSKLQFRGAPAALFGWYVLLVLPALSLGVVAYFVPASRALVWPALAVYGGLTLFTAPYLFVRWVYGRTYWRKRRFIFEADYAEWFGVFMIYLLLCPLVSLGLLLPWGIKRYILWDAKNLEVAGRQFCFHGRARELLGWMLLNIIMLPLHILTLGFTAAFIGVKVTKWFVRNRKFLDSDPGIGRLMPED